MENLLASWQEFLRGKKKRTDVAEFSLHFFKHISALHADLKDKTYRHGGYHAFKINDPKPRDIHKASVRDRLVHHALYRTLYPLFDRIFIHDSYSCRIRKGTHRAMNRFRDYGRKVSRNNTQTCWVLKCDIRKFFASIDHDILKNISAENIDDKETLWLIDEIIDSFNPGLPLGNLTSQLLVNVYMNKFDHFIKRRLTVRYYIRYADDFVIMDENRERLQKLIPEIAHFLHSELKLSLHPKKVSISTLVSGIDFLGWVHFQHHRTLRNATEWRMLQRLENLVPLSSNVTSDDISNTSRVASYLGMLSHGDSHKLSLEIQKRYGKMKP
jgi:retron-type reverse transcriptase